MNQIQNGLEMAILKAFIVVLAVLCGGSAALVMMAITAANHFVLIFSVIVFILNIWLSVGCFKLMARGKKDE